MDRLIAKAVATLIPINGQVTNCAIQIRTPTAAEVAQRSVQHQQVEIMAAAAAAKKCNFIKINCL